MNPDLLKQLPHDLFPGVIYIYDLLDSGNFYMNAKFEEILGYDRGEFKDLGAHVIASLIHPDDKERVDKVIELLSKSPPGRPIRTEYRLRDKSGAWRWFADSACVCQTDESGNMTQIVGTALEVTETHEANEAFDRIYRLFQLIMEVVPLAVCWKDVKGLYLGYNRNFLLSAGLRPDQDITGKSDLELPWKDKNAKAYREIEKKVIVSGKGDLNRLEEYAREEGTPLVFRAQRVPIHDGDEIIGVVCIHEDITDSVVLPKALEAMQQRYLFLLQTGSFGIAIVDCASQCIFEVNTRTAVLLDCHPDELVKKPFASCFAEESHEPLAHWLSTVKESPAQTEATFILKNSNSECFPVELSACVVHVEKRSVFRIDIRKITTISTVPNEEELARVAELEGELAELEKKISLLADEKSRALGQLKQSVDNEAKLKATINEAVLAGQAKTLAVQTKLDAALKEKEITLSVQVKLDVALKEKVLADQAKAVAEQAKVIAEQALQIERKKLERALKECEQLQQSLKDVTSDTESVFSKTKDLSAKCETLANENHELNRECDTLEADIEILQSESDALRGELEVLRKDRDMLREERALLEVSQEKFKTDYCSLESNTKDVQAQCSALREECEAVKLQVAEFESTIKKVSLENELLSTQLKSEKLANESSARVLEKFRKEKLALESAVTGLEKELKHLQRSQYGEKELLESTQVEIESLKAEINKLQSALEQAKVELKHLTVELAQSVEARNELVSTHTKTITDLQRKLDIAQVQNDARSREERKDLEVMREQVSVVMNLEARIPLPRMALDIECNIIDWNELARQLFGYMREEAIGQSAMKLIIPRRERPKFKGFVDTVCEKGVIRNTSFENMNEQRKALTCQWFFSPRVDAAGKVIGVDAFVMDMTSFQRPTSGSEIVADPLRSVFEKHSMPMCIVESTTLRFLFVNSAASRFYGSSERSLQRRALTEFAVCGLASLLENFDKSAGAELKPFVCELKLDNGTLRLVEMYASPVWDEDSQKSYVLLLQDVTARTTFEKKLATSEELHRLALEGTRDGIWSWDTVGKKAWFSGLWREMLGYDNEAHTGALDDFYRMVHLEDLGRLRNQVEQVTTLRRHYVDADIRIRSKNGDYRWIRCRGLAVIQHDNGIPSLHKIVGTITDITYLKSLIEQYQDSQYVFEQAQESRNTFLSNMSHELRTPINAVLGFCELLHDAELNQDQQEYLERMWVSSQALLTILNDVRDLTRIEMGTLELEPSFIDSRSFLDEVVGKFQREADAKGVYLQHTSSDTLPNSFEVDSARLKQILENLISNALKFTDSGHVQVEMFAQNREANRATICICVSDTGCGIAEEDREKIFRLFSHDDTTMVRKYGGAGLGLTLCERLSAMMDGFIELSSEVGRGSEFTVKLRLPVSDSPAFISARSGDNPFRKPSRDRRPLTVLFIEDSPLHQDVGRAMLEKGGHEPTVVYSADDALVLLEDDAYDVVLIDLDLPGMLPLDFIRRVKSNTPDGVGGDPRLKTPLPYIIAMAHQFSERSRKACIAAGVDDCITTPLRRESLERALNQVYGKLML